MCSGIKKIIAGEWVSRYYAKLLSMMRYSVCMVHLPSSNLFCSSRHAKQCGIGVFFFAVTQTLIFARDAMLTRVLAMALCLCLSQVGVLSKRMNESSSFLARPHRSVRYFITKS